MASTSTADPSGEQRAVPGPPRGRRRRVVGDLRARVDAMRLAETVREGGGLLRLSRDVILLLKDLATSPDVPRRERWLAAAAAAYLVSPVDLVPDWLPGIGQADDLVIAAWAVRRLLTASGFDVIYRLWRGSEEGLALVLTLAGVEK